MGQLYSLTEIYGVGSARMFQLRRPGTWLSSQWVGRLWCLVAVRLIAAADNHVWCCLYLGTAEGQKAGINVPPTTHSASARFEIEIKASLSFFRAMVFQKTPRCNKEQTAEKLLAANTAALVWQSASCGEGDGAGQRFSQSDKEGSLL